MSSERTFDAGVLDSSAILPEPPAAWSYSSLKNIEGCPRRYVLSNAKYPDLWQGFGYPDVPTPAALFGDMVHDSLEKIIGALVDRGCSSAIGPEAVKALVDLGGYSEVVKRSLDKRLRALEGNPRVNSTRMDRIRQQLQQRVPEAREEVQSYLYRMTLQPGTVTTGKPGADQGSRRYPRDVGSHPEAVLQADGLRLRGRIDLLTVLDDHAEITDHKTGAEDDGHRAQVRIYSLLWALDSVSNQERKPVDLLTISYPTRDVAVDPPDDTELAALETSMQARIADADVQVRSDEPIATPNEHCSLCRVRSLCDVYWRTTPELAELRDEKWFDYEGEIAEQNGVKSWRMQGPKNDPQLLLRTTSTQQTFQPGQRVRLIGLRRDSDPEVDGPVAMLTPNSEVFCLVGRQT